jgi:DUF4097 and DUF4098 domain-containing protein YvlB
MKPVAKVLILVGVLGFLVLGSAVFIGACAVTHLHFGNGGLHSGVEANRVETHELAFDSSQPLRAQVDCGSIRVASTTGTTAQVVARLRAFGSDKEDAEKRLAQMSLDLGQNSVAAHEQREHSLKFFEFGGGEEIDLEITLPAGSHLDVQSGSGDVHVQGAFGDTRASSDYGDVEASGIRGALVMKSSSGEIKASEVQGGTVSVDTSYGDIALRLIKTSRLEAHTSSGTIEASEIEAESVRLASDYGDIGVRGLKGDLDTKTSSGKVSITEASGACRAHSDYGDVAASGIFRNLSLTSSSGAVRGTAGPGSTLTDGWEITSDYGDVRLQLPVGLSFELDATTDYGEVRANLPGVLGGSKGDETRKLHGAVGGGGPKLRLHSSSGDVEIGTR